VDEMKNYSNWKSVIAWGRYQELTDEHDRYFAMKVFIDKMLRLKISETATHPEPDGKNEHPRQGDYIKPVIYRIVLTEKTGRFENN
jgi:nitroimidazol reductase NimA-like FMN-containing flavoprotein (pyridoxamine 5'-phosphate oxidase superfamily)